MSRAAAIRLVSLLMRLARELRIWGLSSRPPLACRPSPPQGGISLHSGFCGSDCDSTTSENDSTASQNDSTISQSESGLRINPLIRNRFRASDSSKARAANRADAVSIVLRYGLLYVKAAVLLLPPAVRAIAYGTLVTLRRILLAVVILDLVSERSERRVSGIHASPYPSSDGEDLSK
jgi:hypothetical protein